MKSSGGKSLISIAGFVNRSEYNPGPRWTFSCMWINVGSVRNVKPAQRISTVAFPIKYIEPFVKSVTSDAAGILVSRDTAEAICHTTLQQILVLSLIIL